MDYEVWEKHFSGFSIVDCFIFNERRICLCLKEDPPEGSPTVEDDDLLTRLVINRRDERPGADWVMVELRKNKHPKLAASTVPDERVLVLSFYGEVFALGGGKSLLEKDMPILEGVSITDSATIEGVLYASGTSRTVMRREGANKWTALTRGLKTEPAKGDDLDDWGFNALDGFNRKDIYAGGGLGDLWQFNGTTWRQRDLGTNLPVNGVACGGGGHVYVVSDGGGLFVGRDDNWEKVAEDDTEDDLDEVAWYQDRVYIASWSGLYHVRNRSLKKVVMKGRIKQRSFGHVSSGSGLLLSAGPKEAFLYDGKSWEQLVPDNED